MFFKSKKETGALSRAQLSFLNEADREYMKAFNTRSVRDLQQYLSRDSNVKVSRRVYGIGTRYFGSDRFRNTEWVVQSKEGNMTTVQKKVTFDKVKVAGSICIGVADDYDEIWILDTDQTKVVDIREIKAG